MAKRAMTRSPLQQLHWVTLGPSVVCMNPSHQPPPWSTVQSRIYWTGGGRTKTESGRAAWTCWTRWDSRAGSALELVIEEKDRLVHHRLFDAPIDRLVLACPHHVPRLLVQSKLVAGSSWLVGQHLYTSLSCSGCVWSWRTVWRVDGGEWKWKWKRRADMHSQTTRRETDGRARCTAETSSHGLTAQAARVLTSDRGPRADHPPEPGSASNPEERVRRQARCCPQDIRTTLLYAYRHAPI